MEQLIGRQATRSAAPRTANIVSLTAGPRPGAVVKTQVGDVRLPVAPHALHKKLFGPMLNRGAAAMADPWEHWDEDFDHKNPNGKRKADIPMPQELPQRIGFIGAGQMAEALARGFVAQGISSPAKMRCTDPNDVRRGVFEEFGATAYGSSLEVIKNSDIVFIAVKPQYVSVVLKEAAEFLTDNHVVVSIAAGVTVGTMQSAAGPNAKIIRVMPNTPCLVSATAAAMCRGAKATAEDGAAVMELMSSVGTCVECDEKLFNAVTAVSGSGPAYVFLAIEALADGGVAAGLPRDISLQLAAQTVMGSAKMVVETGKHPGQLKDAVCSPAGTTIAGVHQLEVGGLRAAFMNAVKAAANRADELSKM
eukprot:jgi/Tetstr1/439250/TSEL_027692.t1